MKPLPELLPGDCLVYRPSSLFGWITAVKTWSMASHVEVYHGDGQSVASRNGIGVNLYPTRYADLLAILRPKVEPLDFAKADEWFEKTAKGQKYDFIGLFCFYLAVKHGSRNRMFCSEFATREYRKLGLDAVNVNWDADKTAPAQFLQSPTFNWIWTRCG